MAADDSCEPFLAGFGPLRYVCDCVMSSAAATACDSNIQLHLNLFCHRNIELEYKGEANRWLDGSTSVD